MRTALKNVRFPPNSDRKSRHLPKVCFTPESGHVRCTSPCLLWARADIHEQTFFTEFTCLAHKNRDRREVAPAVPIHAAPGSGLLLGADRQRDAMAPN